MLVNSIYFIILFYFCTELLDEVEQIILEEIYDYEIEMLFKWRQRVQLAEVPLIDECFGPPSIF